MPNKFVIFPQGKQTEAEAYKAWGDGKYQELAGQADPGGQLGLLEVDVFGQFVTVYFGPPYEFIANQVVEEPEDGPAMRADGVLHTDWVRPEPPPEV